VCVSDAILRYGDEVFHMEGMETPGTPWVAAALRPLRFRRHTCSRQRRQTDERTNEWTSPLRTAPAFVAGLNNYTTAGIHSCDVYYYYYYYYYYYA